jgi:hypothetical protein
MQSLLPDLETVTPVPDVRPSKADRHGPASTSLPRARLPRLAAFATLTILSALAILIWSEAMLRARVTVPIGDLPGRFLQNRGYYSYEPGSRFTWTNEDGLQVPIRIDEKGFRNPPGTLPDCEAILLGDSYAAGLNTPEPATLAGCLRRKGLRVYDAGVDMFSNGEALQALADLLRGSRPRLVILALYLGNDFRDNLFVRIPKPPSTGIVGRLKAAYFALAARSLLLRGFHTHIYLGLLRGKASDTMASFALSEMISYRHNYPRAMETAVARTDSILGAFAAEATRRDIRLVVMGIPSKAMVLRSFKEVALFETDARSREFALETVRGGYSFDKPDSLAQALAARHALPYLPLLPLFRNRFDAQPYYKIDTHWRAVGESLAADALWEFLKENASGNPWPGKTDALRKDLPPKGGAQLHAPL